MVVRQEQHMCSRLARKLTSLHLDVTPALIEAFSSGRWARVNGTSVMLRLLNPFLYGPCDKETAMAANTRAHAVQSGSASVATLITILKVNVNLPPAMRPLSTIFGDSSWWPWPPSYCRQRTPFRCGWRKYLLTSSTTSPNFGSTKWRIAPSSTTKGWSCCSTWGVASPRFWGRMGAPKRKERRRQWQHQLTISPWQSAV